MTSPTHAGPEELKYLRFHDWLASGREIGDWIAVAQSEDSPAGDFHMRSGLLRNTKQNLEMVLKKPDWGPVHLSGYPTLISRKKGRSVYSPDGRTPDYPVRSFVIKRDFHGVYPATFELLQEFVLYHNLLHRDQEYINPLTDEVVIRLSTTKVVVRAHQLRDFLAASKSVLVRFHDHRRDIDGKHENLSGQWRLKIAETHFLITIGTVPAIPGIKTVGRILGKDLILGYTKPVNPEWREGDRGKRQYAEFIIGRDHETGEEKLLPCDGRQFLTPVYFRRSILKKYYDNPRLYSVEPGYIRNLHFWGIPYGINSEGYLHVWLGDLGHLPYEEQLLWKTYNVVPTGRLSAEFWESQMEARFVDLDRLEHRILRHRSEINESFKQVYEFPLFLDPQPGQAHILKTLHEPVTTEQQELHDQLLTLCKLLQDSIAVRQLAKLIKNQSAITDAKGGRVPPIAVLDTFLHEQFGNEYTSAAVVNPLRLLQQFRSSSGAVHRINSEELEKAMKNLGVRPNATTGEVFVAIASQIESALAELQRLLNKRVR